MLNNIFSPKIFTVINRNYTRKQFTADLLAGIVVGIVALPLAIAFAVASGVSPEKGLVTHKAFATGIVDNGATRRSCFACRLHNVVRFVVLDKGNNQFKVHFALPL